MIIAEIGCGADAGPFIEGAEKYLAIDSDPLAIARTMRRRPLMTAVLDNAETLETVASGSVDLVIARNVFGDPMLGHDLASMPRLIGNSYEEMVEFKKTIHERKQKILRTAARILLIGGRLVVVEQYTPHVAEDFLSTTENIDDLSVPTAVDLASVTSEDYAKYQLEFAPTHTWAMERIQAFD